MSTRSDKYILAIDLGTSGPKVALVSTHGEVVDSVFEEIPLLLFPHGGAEQRPDDWWHAITQAARRLLGRSVVPADAIVALSCTSQWSGTVAVDREGHHLMNAVIWMDSRGAPYVKQIAGGPIAIEGYGVGKLLRWVRLTGGAPGHSGKDPIAHILYIKHELPEIYRATYKFLEPKDYLNLRLTGQFAASYDSITLHWVTDNRNIDNVVYDRRLLALAGIDREKLPDLKRAIDILGPIQPAVAAELGLSERIPVIMGTPDVQSAAIGSGAVQDYAGHLYIGTSSWLACHVPFKKTDILHNMASLPSAIPGRYLLTNEQETAGACLTFLRDKVVHQDDAPATKAQRTDAYATLDRLAEQAPAGSGKLIFTPWLFGERTPVEDHTVRGAFFNLSLQTTHEQLTRAVFEGVAYNSRWLLGYVEQFIKRRLGAITMVGGGAKSNIWCQIHADVLGRPVRQVKDPIQANVRGAAFLAALALGHIAVEDIAARIQIANTYEPQPQHRPIYDELFREFINIYKRNKPIYARLNRAK